ncbi:MAG: CRISPR system precrRNA processing endoribonuclease RAMP protein Cas6 [Nitrospirae bacterium]|nr:CRISPR system precrRNA processing endoribonuclease RAMP protein Cas6 [Nitrospirota bacterium]
MSDELYTAVIAYKKFTVSLRARDTLKLPLYKGSTLRGGFGGAFRRIFCTQKKTDCRGCNHKGTCVYSYVFETPPPVGSAVMRKYEAAPHPFVINPTMDRKTIYKSGEEISFGLTLIGRAVTYLLYFISAFDEFGKNGIGKGRGEFELKEVVCDGGNTIYDDKHKVVNGFNPSYLTFSCDAEVESTTKSLKLVFLSPSRIIYGGTLVVNPDFHVIIRQLLRRVSLLSYFHCSIDPSKWDFKGLIELARGVKVTHKRIRWYDWQRYSSRQDTKMSMGGFMGEMTLSGKLEPFRQLLRLGEVLHIGKGTSLGLGKFKIENV